MIDQKIISKIVSKNLFHWTSAFEWPIIIPGDIFVNMNLFNSENKIIFGIKSSKSWRNQHTIFSIISFNFCFNMKLLAYEEFKIKNGQQFILLQLCLEMRLKDSWHPSRVCQHSNYNHCFHFCGFSHFSDPYFFFVNC